TGEPLPEKEHHHFTTFSGYPVFNADQVEGGAEWVFDTYGLAEDASVEPIEHAEAWVAATGATIIHGAGGASYRPTGDLINLPLRDSFVDATAYYATVAHELGHWTGAEKRLARPGITKTGAEKTRADYAFEELVAELTSVFVGATQLGIAIEPREENAQYLDFWIRQLSETPKILWTAAAAANKAATFLAELQPAEFELELPAAA
ncbi:MAG: antirestriction protein, partial [bacterium]|nr:antirestriction protein [bacterium]